MTRDSVTAPAAVFLLLAAACVASGAGPALGVVTANGDFRLNKSTVNGNATLLDGALVETAGTPSRLRLNSGPVLDLGAKAKATVFRDRLVLEAGVSDFSTPGEYRIEAGTLRIAAATADGSGRVARLGQKTVQVGALKGALRVYNSQGILLANVAQGSALQLEPQVGGAAPPSSFLGCLLKKEGKFILFDQTTRIVVELRGSGFESEWGNRVQAIGTTDTAATSQVAAQVVDVTSLTRFAEGGCSPVASAIGAELPPAPEAQPAGAPAPPAKTPGPAPSGGGMSAGAKVAIIAAVAGGGAGAALAATSSGEDRSRD